jgi:negative regulator of flagellin synthesis FlgM
MEIDNNRIASLATHVSSQGAPVDSARTNNGKADNQPAGTAGSSDRVSLTGQACQLRELEAQLATEPVVDRQRVTAIRSAVENGTFAVNPQRIAEKMISLEQLLPEAR